MLVFPLVQLCIIATNGSGIALGNAKKDHLMIYEKSWCDQRLSEHHAGPFVLDEMLRKHYLIKAKAAWPSSKRTSLILPATPAIPFLR